MLSLFEDKKIMIGKNAKIFYELEACFFRFVDCLGAWHEHLSWMRSVLAARRIIYDHESSMPLHSRAHFSVKIHAVRNVMCGVAEECHINRILRQHRVIFAGNNGSDVMQTFLVRALFQIIKDVSSDINRVNLALRGNRSRNAPREVAGSRADIGNYIAVFQLQCFYDFVRLLP